MSKPSIGSTGNSIAGAVGGIALAQIIDRMTGVTVSPEAAAAATSGLDIGNIIKWVVSSGVGGAIVTAIVGAIKNQ